MGASLRCGSNCMDIPSLASSNAVITSLMHLSTSLTGIQGKIRISMKNVCEPGTIFGLDTFEKV